MKITIEVSRRQAISLLRQLEAELRPDQPAGQISADSRERSAILAMYAKDFPWPEDKIYASRVRNAFGQSEPNMTIADLCQRVPGTWLAKNLSRGSKEYISKALAERGLRLGMNVTELRAYRQD